MAAAARGGRRWPERRAPTPTPAGATARRVLVADDNADMREYVGRLLHAALASRRSRTALQRSRAARRTSAGLVLTDVMMPGLDGFGCCAALRARSATARHPGHPAVGARRRRGARSRGWRRARTTTS